jgi:hypothetical protein
MSNKTDNNNPIAIAQRTHVRAGLRQWAGLDPETSLIRTPDSREFVREGLQEWVHGKPWWPHI